MRSEHIYKTPEEAFTECTKQLLEAKRAFGLIYQFKVGLRHNMRAHKAYNLAWYPKMAYKGGVALPWGKFLIEAVFPEDLYRANGRSLKRLLKDERFFDYPSAIKRDCYHSHVGRMCRPRKVFEGTKYTSYLDYLLDRFGRKEGCYRSMPHFYFDCESPEWMFKDFFKNLNQVRSWRTATSCTANFSFRWDTKRQLPICIQILKHSQYAHIYGDFCGSAAFMRAVCRELGYDPKRAEVILFAVSASMDGPKQAKNFLNIMDNRRPVL